MLKVLVLMLLFPVISGAVVHGKELRGSPDLVRLIFKNEWVCSGVFIDPFTILTASHCVVLDEAGHHTQLKEVRSADNELLDVVQTESFAHPRFKNYSDWHPFDVGIIKTSANVKFMGEFKFAHSVPSHLGKALIYGCGKTSGSGELRMRAFGENYFLRLGPIISFLSANSAEGSVAIAPNDSGGPIVDAESKVILGVATGTTAKESEAYRLPYYSTGTSILTDENFDFVQRHMGAQPLH